MYASAAGRQAPRPRPASSRNVLNHATFGAKTTAIVKMENHVTQATSRFRRPKRSESGAMKSAPSPTPTREMVAANVAPTASKPSSCDLMRVGMTVPSTTRSKPSSTMASQQSHTGHRDFSPMTTLSNDDVDIATSALVFT